MSPTNTTRARLTLCCRHRIFDLLFYRMRLNAAGDTLLEHAQLDLAAVAAARLTTAKKYVCICWLLDVEKRNSSRRSFCCRNKMYVCMLAAHVIKRG